MEDEPRTIRTQLKLQPRRITPKPVELLFQGEVKATAMARRDWGGSLVISDVSNEAVADQVRLHTDTGFAVFDLPSGDGRLYERHRN